MVFDGWEEDVLLYFGEVVDFVDEEECFFPMVGEACLCSMERVFDVFCGGGYGVEGNENTV